VKYNYSITQTTKPQLLHGLEHFRTEKNRTDQNKQNAFLSSFFSGNVSGILRKSQTDRQKDKTPHSSIAASESDKGLVFLKSEF